MHVDSKDEMKYYRHERSALFKDETVGSREVEQQTDVERIRYCGGLKRDQVVER